MFAACFGLILTACNVHTQHTIRNRLFGQQEEPSGACAQGNPVASLYGGCVVVVVVVASSS